MEVIRHLELGLETTFGSKAHNEQGLFVAITYQCACNFQGVGKRQLYRGMLQSVVVLEAQSNSPCNWDRQFLRSE